MSRAGGRPAALVVDHPQLGSRSAPSRSMVFTKLLPWAENTQEVRRITCARAPPPRTASLARQLGGAVDARAGRSGRPRARAGRAAPSKT